MTDTIIIGAGIAGLAAGQYLMKKNHHHFIVLESADQIGGRVQTIEFHNQLFSIGPGWVHGKNGNPIFDILTNLQVKMELVKPLEKDSIFVWDTEEQKNVTDCFIEKRERFHELIGNLTEKYIDSDIDPKKSFKDLLAENSDLFHSMNDIDKTVLYVCLEIFLGAPLNEVSAMAEIQYDEMYTEDEEVINYRITDPLGVTKLIEFLSKDFKDKIRLNSKVKTIEWNKESNEVGVILENGEQLLCKDVIITVQSNLLANNSITFQPELPDEKVNAFKCVPAVNYSRLFAKFPSKFWPNKDLLIPVIKNVDPINELIFWLNCGCQNLCSENDNILVCHIASGSREGNNRFNVDKEQLIELVTESMKKMFPDTYCAPVDVLYVSFWNNDRYAGAFSQTCPGFDKSHIENLKESVGPLHFAGESVFVELIGTMQAAYLSGRNAAKNILI